jgi:glycosyltransferase involved in cell wall biosynthesis
MTQEMSDNSRRRLRVLLLAEMCNPNWPSAPLNGFSFAKAFSHNPELDVTLVTQIRNRSALENHPDLRNARIEFIDTEWIAKSMYKLGMFLRGGQLAWTIDTASQWPAYVSFEYQIWRKFKRELRDGKYDLIHRIIPVSPVLPSVLPAKTNVPMIFGPTNGGLAYPKQFRAMAHLEREWLTRFRKLYKSIPFTRTMFRKLSGLIVGSKSTGADISSIYTGPRFFMPENGIDPDRFELRHEWPKPHGKFRFISIGRLVLFKCFHLLIEAFSRSEILRECELSIIGDGPLRVRLESRVKQLGLSERIFFRGWLPHETVDQELRQSQCFVFPSVREFGGAVVLEAMASSLPTIVADYGGPAELVTEETGIRIPLAEEPLYIERIRESMERMYLHPDLCKTMGESGSRRIAKYYTWEAKTKQIINFYHQVLNS